MPMGLTKNENTPTPGGRFFFRGGAKKNQEEGDWFRTHDSFTSLPNMNLLRQDFEHLTQRNQWVVALIHIYDFIQLNSIFGLDLGGKIIQRVCPILDEFAQEISGRAYRPSIGRLAVLAPAPDRDGFLRGLEETLHKMEDIHVEDQNTVYTYHYHFSYSLYYLSDAPEEYQDIDSLLAFINITAQHKFGNDKIGGTIYDLESKPVWARRDNMLSEVHEAWKNKQFEPCYQPVYDLKTRKPVGAELLIRWRHPQRGLIPPADFLPLMEAEGLMMDMDLYMLDAACQKIKHWMDEGLITVPLSINICKQNIHRADFLPRVIEIVTSYDIPPVLIELELNESGLLFEKSNIFLYMMEQLHRIGFTLTMDDCGGKELSSIGLLRELPLDVVKINQHFIDRVDESERDRLFVTNVLRMAKELGIKTVATSVETEEQASTWLNLGCSVGQGFLFSRPVFSEDFEKLIF